MDDLISRQAAIAYAISGKVRTLPTSEDGENWIRTEEVRQSLLAMPSAEPEIIRCKNCEYLQKWRSEESARKFGQVYTCEKNILYCPKPEDFCSRAERRIDG